MSCQSQNCFTEDEIQGIFNNISSMTGLCFPAINTSFVPAGTTVTTGFLIQGNGSMILQDSAFRIILGFTGSAGNSTQPFRPC